MSAGEAKVLAAVDAKMRGTPRHVLGTIVRFGIGDYVFATGDLALLAGDVFDGFADIARRIAEGRHDGEFQRPVHSYLAPRSAETRGDVFADVLEQGQVFCRITLSELSNDAKLFRIIAV